MSFSSQEVERAIRDFINAVDDLLNATHHTYQSKVNRLMYLVSKNKVINHIVKPFLEMPLEFSEIEKPDPSGGILDLPVEMNKWIAYVIQTLNKSYKGEILMWQYATHFFKKPLAESFNILNEEVIRPCMRELVNKLEDLIKDEVEGKQEVTESNLQIIEVGDITAGGNVAIGKDIKQEYKYSGIKEEIIAEFLKVGIPFEQINKIRPDIEELVEILKKPKIKKSEESKLKRIMSKFKEVGGPTIIQLITSLYSILKEYIP